MRTVAGVGAPRAILMKASRYLDEKCE